VIEAVLDGADPQLCVSRFEGDAALADVLDDLRTLPFLAPRRLVIVDDADDFIKAHRSALEDYLEHPATTGTLLLCPKSFPGNTKLAKRVAAIGAKFDCSPPAAKDIPGWIAKRAAREGKQLDGRAADLMAQWLGPDLARIDSELTKLTLYVGERPNITVEDVSAVVVATADVSPWALTDALTAGDAKTALGVLEKLLTQPGEEFRVLGLIGWHLRRVLKAKQMLIAGRREADVFSTVRVFGPGQTAMRRILQQRSIGQIGRDFRELIRTDLAMKTGRDAKAALQRLVVALC
jgi:DNA polymerase-3 subunit delta